MFSTERRRAKVLNFSIAYGKTPHGLAKDWNVTVREAQNTLDLWYKDRPEVMDWQVKKARAFKIITHRTFFLNIIHLEVIMWLEIF